MGRRGAAILGAVVLLALVALLAYRETVAPEAGLSPSSSSPAGSTSPWPFGTSAVSPSRPANAPQAADDDEWKPDDLPAKAARLYAAAGDKRAFYERAMNALEQCQVVNQYGMVGAEQMLVSGIADSPILAQRIAAFRAHIKGCEGFETRRIDPPQFMKISQRIREQTDLAALAYSLRPGNLTTTELQAGAQMLALRALDTGDAYLLTELASYFALRQAGLLGSPRIASSADPRIDAMQRERDAWMWASCELGVDCGPGSANGRRVCFEMGKCEWRSIDDIAPELFADNNRTLPRERKDEIVAAVRARDWARLGF
jgi:hypothetical protein